MNIDPITNLNAERERAAKTAKRSYAVCQDTIETQILNWSPGWGNRKMEMRSGSNPAPNPASLTAVQVTARNNCYHYLELLEQAMRRSSKVCQHCSKSIDWDNFDTHHFDRELLDGG